MPCYLTGLPQGSTATYFVTWTSVSRGPPCSMYDETLVRFRSSTWLIQRAKGLGWNVYGGFQVALRHWSSYIWAAQGCRNVSKVRVLHSSAPLCADTSWSTLRIEQATSFETSLATSYYRRLKSQNLSVLQLRLFVSAAMYDLFTVSLSLSLSVSHFIP